MKVLMLSWEYPPKSIGGLSNHVYNLSHALKKQGHEVYVITCGDGIAPEEEIDEGVFVKRVIPYEIDTKDFVKWVMQLNFAMIEAGTKLLNVTGRAEVIHIHDWLVAYAGKALKGAFSIPLISTIHATEYGRNNGIRTEMQKYISDTEVLLTQESWRIAVCSEYMKQQVTDIFKCSSSKIRVIANGVNSDAFEIPDDLDEFKKRFASENEKVISFIGRHVFEKGAHLLIDAIPKVLEENKNTKFIIAGIGPMTEELKRQTESLKLKNSVVFAGYLNDEDKNRLYKVSDAVVIPSLYEPFGIVALEAMAAGCPLIVSDSGGLNEIVEHGKNALKTIAGSSESIAHNILEILKDGSISKTLKEGGLLTVASNYTWGRVAEFTSNMYMEVKAEAAGTEWEVREKRPRGRKSSRTIDDEERNLESEVAATSVSKRGRKKKST